VPPESIDDLDLEHAIAELGRAHARRNTVTLASGDIEHLQTVTLVATSDPAGRRDRVVVLTTGRALQELVVDRATGAAYQRRSVESPRWFAEPATALLEGTDMPDGIDLPSPDDVIGR
jgi:hypothetical protein